MLEKISADTTALLEGRHGHYLNGQAIPGSGHIDVFDPATGQPIGSVAAGGKDEIDAAVEAAREALSGPWGNMRPDDRSQILLEFARLCEEDTRLFTELTVLNGGAPWAIGETTSFFLRAVPALLRRLVHQDRRPDAALLPFRPDARHGSRVHQARTNRRRRRDYTLELPIRHGDAENRAGARHRLHAGAEARGANPVCRADPGRTRDPRRTARRRLQCRQRAG